MLWDTHMHTYFSGDSKANPESMIQAAKTLGLAGICFTDHVDTNNPDGTNAFWIDLSTYLPTMKDLSKINDKKLTICVGIELGLQPHLTERLNRIVSGYEFDFVIASSHTVHGLDPYHLRYFDNKTDDEAYAEYFSSIMENITIFNDFDVYGHLDYVVRYGATKNKFYSYEKFSDIIDEVLRTLIHMGKGIEINTSGFKCGLGHPHPTETILKRYRELGGEIITIGSDAHKPDHVGYDFDKVPKILREAGFRYFTVFKERKPIFFPLQ